MFRIRRARAVLLHQRRVVRNLSRNAPSLQQVPIASSAITGLPMATGSTPISATKNPIMVAYSRVHDQRYPNTSASMKLQHLGPYSPKGHLSPLIQVIEIRLCSTHPNRSCIRPDSSHSTTSTLISSQACQALESAGNHRTIGLLFRSACLILLINSCALSSFFQTS